MNNLKVTRKNIYLIAGFVLMFFVFAGSNVSAADKIGFINLQEIVQNSNAGKKAAEDFKKLLDKKKAAVTVVENELKKIKDDLDKQRTILKESAYKEKDSIFQKKYRDYQLLIKDTEKELKDRDQEVASLLIPEIFKAVRVIAEKEKYTMILDVSTMPLPYYDKASDISKKVIDEYNNLSASKK
jgi:outer membrane protein